MLYRIFRLMFRAFFYSLYRLKVYGTENIPAQGAVILCSNHISLLDPPIVGTPLQRKVHYMAKAELFNIPILGRLISNFGAFPVKRGGVSRESIRHCLALLADGKVLGVFPEGTRHNKSGKGQKGAASLALKSKATVIPVAIIGQYKLFRPMKLVYGEPIDLSDYAHDSSSQGLEHVTELIMASIEALKHKN